MQTAGKERTQVESHTPFSLCVLQEQTRKKSDGGKGFDAGAD